MAPEVMQCPVCAAAMILRTARRGPNAGNQFWGCSGYPKCKGTRDTGPEVNTHGGISSSALESTETRSSVRVPVPWADRTNREAWIAEYTTIGSLAGFSRNAIGVLDDADLDTLSQTLILSTRGRSRASSETQRIAASLLAKIFQRGRAPLPTIAVEVAAIECNELGDIISWLPEDHPEIGFETGRGFKLSKAHLVWSLARRSEFRLAGEFSSSMSAEVPLFDATLEEDFLCQWVSNNLPAGAGHWFIPQANLDRLLEANGKTDGGARRVDFLFAHPLAKPLVVEIDGHEHDDDPAIDKVRDELLAGIGIKVIRITNSEMEEGDGDALQAVRGHCEKALLASENITSAEQGIIDSLLQCMSASKLQLAITRALQFGWLEPNGIWAFDIEGIGDVAFAAVTDLLQLISGLDLLYGTDISPSSVTIRTSNTEHHLSRNHSGEYIQTTEDAADAPQALQIVLENDKGPFHETPSGADIIIRPVFLPVQLAVESSFSTNVRPTIRSSDHDAEVALTPFLQQIFRKRQFRELQAKSVLNALCGVDSIILLPTGAGKSIIYQLAGLLMPGVTLVVDPIVSLIEDQVEGLLQYGIDRAVGITAAINSTEERERLLRGVERGAYQFVLHSPERLQSPAFRSTLRALAETSRINLAVIDEAHCVSEWGHDFRPAYLNLGRNLRTFGKDRNGSPPTLIALTGTASRSVLRDVLTELDIDRSNSDALIRPHSFDREELHFHISRPERTDDVSASLRGILHQLPDKFGLPKDEFYRPAGRKTASGIVFVPFVNGWTHGIMAAKEAVRTATGANVTHYSGKAPKGQEANWEVAKRINVKEFKSNDAPVLVSTKAFGMGIDKPNIRYTVHLGMPGSLEGFYQEAGRAGRDRTDAHCAVVFSEFDEDRSDALLDPSIDLVEARNRFDEQTKKRKNDDDVTRALWFHLNSFTGQEEELTQVDEVLNAADTLDAADTFDLPFNSGMNGRSGQERALFRLVKVGAIRDYEVIYGSHIFRVYVAAFDLGKCKASLLEYVQSAQPGRVKMFAQQLDAVSPDIAASNALSLSELLIEFTYDVIERSRRRAIQEAVLLARRSNSDAEIRRRLLDYLQEGVGTEAFDVLLAETDVKFEPWCEFIDKILSPIDAGEIRGMAIRSLESYPDHPGLLMIRGVSEMMCSDADETTAFQALHTLLKSSGERYAISDHHLTETFSWILDVVRAKAPNLGLPLASAFYFAAEEEGLLSPSLSEALEELLLGLKIPEVAIVRQTVKMTSIANDITVATRSITASLSDDHLRKIIGTAA